MLFKSLHNLLSGKKTNALLGLLVPLVSLVLLLLLGEYLWNDVLVKVVTVVRPVTSVWQILGLYLLLSILL